MAEICILSSCNIQSPTSLTESENRRIELTPWDLQLLMVGPIQKGLVFLKPPIHHDQQQKDLINHLKMSLSKTLDFFPPLAGRLTAVKNEDNTTSFFITCNNAGVQFTHATVNNLKVGDILEPVYVPRIVHSFFQLTGYNPNHEGTSKPLLSIQVTELVDGFFIGCTMNHSVADGSCFWHFMNSWSEISRNFCKISKMPLFQPWFPNDINCPIPIPIPSEQFISTATYIPPSTKERVFNFPKENIKKLKEKANSEMGTNNISSLQALLAHVWRSVIRCRRVDSVQETYLMVIIGTRTRLLPNLPAEYFGNAVQFEFVKTSAGELLNHGLGWAASRINETVALQTHEEVTKFYKGWIQSPKVLKLGGLPGNAITISSSPRFNMYGNDFGWGKPVAVRSGGGNKSDGKITVFSGAEEGSIDLEVCLVAETLHAMEDDEEFMEAVKKVKNI